MAGIEAIDRLMTDDRKEVYVLMKGRQIGSSEKVFACEFFARCDESVHGGLSKGRKGDWAYVGAQYGRARISGRQARILFVSMDRNRVVSDLDDDAKGDDPEFWSFEAVQSQFRNACSQGDPHMNGVGRAMQCMVGADVARNDYAQQFALVNSVLCGVRWTDTESRAEPTMKRNCSEHVKTILAKLEPDILVAQGMDQPRSLVEAFETYTVKRWPGKGAPRVARGEFEGRYPWIVITAHPGFYSRGIPGKERLRHGPAGLLPNELEEAFDLVRDRYSRGDGADS